MRCSPNLLVSGLVLLSCAGAFAQGTTYNLGRTPSAEEIRALDIAIGPDGKELPPGSGTAKEGAQIFAEKCAACHGTTGEGGVAPRLVGGKGTLTSLHPQKTVGSFWASATTVWDYINRAMPQNQPGSLRPNEVYALTAFLLNRNGIIEESYTLDVKSLPKVQMPNRNGFIPAVVVYPEPAETTRSQHR
jgi:mono/diheme cytochrome c family protein